MSVATEPIALTGVIPAGAEGLDPFIAAQSLELNQAIEGTPDKMVAGDSVTRRVVAADNRDLLLVDQLEMPSLAPYLRHPAPLICIGAPSAEALDDRARDGGEDPRTPDAAEGDETTSDDPDAALFADVRLLRNLMLALAAAH